MRTLDAEARADLLAELAVDVGDAGFAIELDEGVAARKIFEFFFDQRLIADEGLEKIVGEGHIAAGFPVADGVGFLEFAIEGDFGLYVEPESEIGAQSHLINAVEIIAADAADGAARDQACRYSGRRER